MGLGEEEWERDNPGSEGNLRGESNSSQPVDSLCCGASSLLALNWNYLKMALILKAVKTPFPDKWKERCCSRSFSS